MIRTARRGAPLAALPAAGAIAFCAALVGAALPAAASPVAAADDLCSNNVTFEDDAVDIGFLTDDDLDALDAAALDLQGRDGFLKVVVLGSPPDESSFPQDVLERLGGGGRVVVFDPTATNIATDVDAEAELRPAELAAEQAFNADERLASALEAAADQLGVTGAGTAVIPTYCTTGAASSGDGSTGTGDAGNSAATEAPPTVVPSASDGEGSGGGGGGSGFFLVLLLLAGGALLAFVLLRRRRKRVAPESATSIDDAELTVRSAVDKASNLVIDLADRIELPDANPEAKRWYREGAASFADVQDELEDADTRAELEAVYPKVVELGWKLETAQALLDGGSVPARPTPPPLFPPLVSPPSLGPSPAPSREREDEPHYRQRPRSPWLTSAAITAISVLLRQGFGGGRSNQWREPADDPWSGGSYGSGSSGRGVPTIPSMGRSSAGRSSGGRFRMGGRSSRGMGRRR